MITIHDQEEHGGEEETKEEETTTVQVNHTAISEEAETEA